ncbi:hypothetical protein [Novosphingobium olei]|uniref:hypothetical protein n=1 Tax=Novosphingobium olei TaxID=2728851 RepID=UPI00308FAA26|nr:hypothetical protein NSDW_20950 [Novosphingobium olei]
MALIALWPALARADSRFETGTASPTRASAHLDFTIIVPSVAFFRLGTAGTTTPAPQTMTLTTTTATTTTTESSVLSAQVLGNAGSLSLGTDAQGAEGSKALAQALPVSGNGITRLDTTWTYADAVPVSAGLPTRVTYSLAMP